MGFNLHPLMPTMMTIMMMTTVMSWRVFYQRCVLPFIFLLFFSLFFSFVFFWVYLLNGSVSDRKYLERPEFSRRNRFGIGWYLFDGHSRLNSLTYSLGSWCLVGLKLNILFLFLGGDLHCDYCM